MIRAVICDDEIATQKIIRYFIETEGIPVKIIGTAADGESALRLIQSEEPDLVFLDIQMPALNGFEVIERLQKSRAKIIIITVYNTFAHAQRALQLGACDIIAKPIDMEQLRQSITRSLGWRFTSSDTLNRALAYIYQHYAERIELDTLAREACCTASHIAHLFQQNLHVSALSFVNTVRINRAQQLLQEGASVQETAYQVGYASLNNFYKYFNKQIGEPPAAYRQRMQQGKEEE